MDLLDIIHKISESDKNYPQKIFSETSKIHTCINPYSYQILRKKHVPINNFDGLFIDGISMCLWISLFWWKKINRLSFDMTSMARDLFQLCNSTGESIYLIGAKQEEISKAVEILKSEYKNLNIVKYRNGYFGSEQDRDQTIKEIINISPKYVIVGMGTPLQEIFLLDLKKAGFKGIAFTCGGFLHQTASGLEYYPKWVDKYNLRGVYRQFKEKGIFIRNYYTILAFPATFLYDTIKSKFNSNH